MSDRFRDLERPDRHRRPDAVLMATLSNFEGLSQPGARDLRQFAELFAPLFCQASLETRRTAVAVLSRCPQVPAAVARLIASQPVDVAAPFLVNSATLDEAALREIIAGGDVGMARAIARRRALSPATVADLAATGDEVVMRSLRVRGLLEARPDGEAEDEARLAREEALRGRLARLVDRQPEDREPEDRGPADAAIAVPRARPGQIARLLAFAERREAIYFVTALADMLDCSFPLAERIMLDISGRELADALVATGFDRAAATRALESLLPHLARRQGQLRKSDMLINGCDPEDAAARLALRLRADRGAHSPAPEPQLHDSLPGAAGAPRRANAADRPAPFRALRRA